MQAKDKSGGRFTFIHNDDAERRKKAQAHLKPYRKRPLRPVELGTHVSIFLRPANIHVVLTVAGPPFTLGCAQGMWT